MRKEIGDRIHRLLAEHPEIARIDAEIDHDVSHDRKKRGYRVVLRIRTAEKEYEVAGRRDRRGSVAIGAAFRSARSRLRHPKGKDRLISDTKYIRIHGRKTTRRRPRRRRKRRAGGPEASYVVLH
jgi:hypothetical protein